MKPHKYCDLIKAWADGATIEFKQLGEWVVTERPEWDEEFFEYRIQPEPKVIKGIVELQPGKCVFRPGEHWERDNIELTFDSDTGRLLSAQVITPR